MHFYQVKQIQRALLFTKWPSLHHSLENHGWFATRYCLLEAGDTKELSTFNSTLACRWSQS